MRVRTLTLIGSHINAPLGFQNGLLRGSTSGKATKRNPPCSRRLVERCPVFPDWLKFSAEIFPQLAINLLCLSVGSMNVWHVEDLFLDYFSRTMVVSIVLVQGQNPICWIDQA
jgi:hypothetical protein